MFKAVSLKELWQYRELFYFLAWRDVKLKYRQTLLGVLWAIVQPMFTMVVFTILFGHFAKLPSDGIPGPIFYYSALLPWMYFSTTLTYSGGSLVGNANLLTKIYFPRLILPASSVLSGLLDLAIGSLVLLGLMAYYHIRPSWGLFLWPALVILLAFLALAIGTLLAALNVRYRDIKHAMPFVIQLWLFATPIIYPTSLIPDRLRLLIAFNPLTGLIEAFRASLLPGRQVDWQLLGISFVITSIMLACSAMYFTRVERYFADIV